jgi:aminoglycoside phosphotransferase (APT) family kinase protein
VHLRVTLRAAADHSRNTDEHARRAIAQLGARIGGYAALRSWQESLDAPAWDGAEVLVHRDLLPGNLLVEATCLR